MTSIKKNSQGGYALITALIFFMAGGIAVVAALSDSVLREVRTVKNESTSKQSYYTSESSLEDAIFRLKSGKNIGATESLTIASSTATTVITTAVDRTTTIATVGDTQGTTRNLVASLALSQGVSFPFLLQGGLGGVDITDGTITGDVYTTGSIRGCGSCSITGAAVSAATATISVDQANSTPLPPAQSINFGNAASTQDMAQGFRVSDELSLVKIELYLKKVGNPSNATIKIMTGSASAPSSSGVIASGTVSSSLVGTGYTWIDIPLTANQILAPSTNYWIVIDANINASNYYTIAANTTYGNGQAKIGRTDWGSWSNTTPSGLDAYFKLTLGTSDTGIMGEDQYNDLSVGSAYAYGVNYVASSGSLYCQAGAGNNKACDTSRSNPVVSPMPISDATLTLWKNEGLAGGTLTGNQSVGWAGATMGPKKIVGNLAVSGGGTLRVSGTLWVTGTVTINGGAHVRSNDSAKSFVIISDNKIVLSGGASIDGATNSHILLVSTSNAATDAITISGGANDTALYAANGGITVTGGASVKAAAAQHLYIGGGSNVVYDPEMSSLNITADGGATSGSLNIKSWKEY